MSAASPGNGIATSLPSMSMFAASGFVGPDGGSADRAGGNRGSGRARKKRGSAAMLSDTDPASEMAAQISSAAMDAVAAEKVGNYSEAARIMRQCYDSQLKAAGTELDPAPWIRSAQRCECFGHRATAQTTVQQALRNPPARDWFPEDWSVPTHY